MTRHPAAYLRRSYSIDTSREPAREAQEAACRRMANAFEGDAALTLHVDWGISGARRDRKAYQELRTAVAADEISTVYAYSLSRLGRNARELLDFFQLCRDHDTKIVTEAEGALAADTAMGRFLLTIMAAIAELEREQSRERSAAAQAIRQDRGDVMGQRPMGYLHVRNAAGVLVRVPDPADPLAPVLAAYREARTVLGTVKLLNERAVQAPKGGRWHTSSLTRVIEANWPDLLPVKAASGKRVPAQAALAQLVRCHCGQVMTPNTHRRQLYCSMGYITLHHGRYTVQEAPLLEWAKAEAAHLHTPSRVRERQRHDQRRVALGERRLRIVDNYEDGLINRAQRDLRLRQVDTEMERLDTAARVVTVPRIDWAWPPAALNEVLRALWRAVQLDDDMRPIRAEWNVPEWRAA